MRRVGAQNPSAASQPRKDFIGRAVLSRTLFPRLCCGAVLMGLREACIFATARAATKAAAKPAHVPYGQGQHVSTAGSLARPLDGARSALPILVLACVLRAKRCARAFGGQGCQAEPSFFNSVSAAVSLHRGLHRIRECFPLLPGRRLLLRSS